MNIEAQIMNGDQPIRLAVVIPAYKPSAGLIDLVRTLSESDLPAIAIADDGSGPDYRETFAKASAYPGSSCCGTP